MVHAGLDSQTPTSVPSPCDYKNVSMRAADSLRHCWPLPKALVEHKIDATKAHEFEGQRLLRVGVPQSSRRYIRLQLLGSDHMPTFSDISDQLVHQAIELPSWAFGNSGTRFKVFGSPGTPRTVQEKIADAAKVNELTGLAPKVALHIPWDKVEDYRRSAGICG